MITAVFLFKNISVSFSNFTSEESISQHRYWPPHWYCTAGYREGELNGGVRGYKHTRNLTQLTGGVQRLCTHQLPHLSSTVSGSLEKLTSFISSKWIVVVWSTACSEGCWPQVTVAVLIIMLELVLTVTIMVDTRYDMLLRVRLKTEPYPLLWPLWICPTGSDDM